MGTELTRQRRPDPVITREPDFYTPGDNDRPRDRERDRDYERNRDRERERDMRDRDMQRERERERDSRDRNGRGMPMNGARPPWEGRPMAERMSSSGRR